MPGQCGKEALQIGCQVALGQGNGTPMGPYRDEAWARSPEGCTRNADSANQSMPTRPASTLLPEKVGQFSKPPKRTAALSLPVFCGLNCRQTDAAACPRMHLIG